MRRRIQGAKRPAKISNARRQATDCGEALERQPEGRWADEFAVLLRQLAQGALNIDSNSK
jgi:hypothetical protein